MYKLLFFLVIVYLFFLIFTRFIMPWLLKVYIKRMMKKRFNMDGDMFKEAGNSHGFNTDKTKSRKNKQQSKIKENDNDYIEYTEIIDED